MRRVVWRWGWAALLGSGLSTGCEHTGAFQRYPTDPLFARAKPVAGTPNAPLQVARLEPEAPSLPPSAVALVHRARSNSTPKTAPDIPSTRAAQITPPTATLAGRERAPISATPVVRTRELPAPLEQTPASQAHPELGAFARDYRWVEGILERDPRGHVMLRYATPSVSETWGGILVLDDIPCLAAIPEGTLVHAEGEFVFEDGEPALGWQGYPRYRVEAMQPKP
jgi:hypothetical protein